MTTMSKFDPTVSKLPGNVRCITVPIPTSRSITLVVLVRVGSRFETKQHNGISHFMEHMFFKGAQRYPDTMAVAGAIDGAGGNFNAFTGEEMVGYYVKISSLRKEIAYDVLSDMLLNSKFDSEEIEREKGVIIEEIRMHHDDPMSQVYLDYHTLFFGDQPLGWDIAGPEENIRKMTRDDFLEHHKHFYYGGNCVITCAGDITTAEHEELCKKYFTFSGGPETSANPEPFRPMETDRIFVRRKETEQAHFIFGFPAGKAETEETPILKVMNTILGGAMSSRLFYQIRERRGLAYYIHSSYSTYVDTGFLSVSAGVNLEKVEEAISCALAEVAKMKDELVPDDELERAKMNILGSTDLALEDTRRVAMLFGMRETVYGKIKTPEELAEEIRRVTSEQIREMARKYLRDEVMKLALIGPFDRTESLEAAFRMK